MKAINTLADLMGYCTVNEAGCWIWKGGYSQQGYVPVAHIGRLFMPELSKSQRTFSAYRAAWLLAGKRIPAGHVVYRHVCLEHKCVNPAHCKTGTKGDMHARYSASGKNKGQPNRIVANMKNRAKLFLSPEKVLAIQASLDEGMPIKSIMKLHRTDGGTVRKIRAGIHPTQQNGGPVHANASIFSIGRLAA